MTQSETIVVRVALDVLPAFLGMLLLAGAAAIIVSTANSMLLTPATSLARDVYQRFVNPAADDRRLVTLHACAGRPRSASSRFVIGNLFPTILAMALWAYTMYGAGVTPALLAALVWPRATPRGRSRVHLRRGWSRRSLWEMLALTGAGCIPAGHADDLSGAAAVGRDP